MIWDDIEVQEIDLKNPRQTSEIQAFLQGFELDYPGNTDYTAAFYNTAGELAATGSLAKNVLRNIAVAESLQGEGMTASVVSHLLREAAARGFYHCFLFTKPEKAVQFSALGFREIARADSLAMLMETGVGSIEQFQRELLLQAGNLPAGRRAALVMNCNPFTLGHKALVERASRENDAVVVLVVSEDQSVFPFTDRLRLVQQGLAEYRNVIVLPSGPYVVSAATFPGYFTKGGDTVRAQTRLDADLFGRWIAPALGVSRRYIGEEPYSEVTRQYNEALLEVLPAYAIEVTVMPRRKAGDEIISASRVRQSIAEGDWEAVRRMVPDSTYAYLKAPAAMLY